MVGKADYKPAKGFEDRMHVVGKGNNPILILKKKDVPKLFDQNFWMIYELWRWFHHKMPPPICEWNEVNPDLISVIMDFEDYYEQEFSPLSMTFKAMMQRG